MKNMTKMSKEEVRQTMGARIQAERMARRIDRDELCKILGITPSHMGLIERGERGVTAFMLHKVAETFNLPMDVFFKSIERTPVKNKDDAKAMKRAKLAACTVDFSERELDFAISIVSAIRGLNFN